MTFAYFKVPTSVGVQYLRVDSVEAVQSLGEVSLIETDGGNMYVASVSGEEVLRLMTEAIQNHAP